MGTLQAATNITVVVNRRTKDMRYSQVFSFQVVFGLNFNLWLGKRSSIAMVKDHSYGVSQPINFCVLLGFLQIVDTDRLGQYKQLVKQPQRFRVDVG